MSKNIMHISINRPTTFRKRVLDATISSIQGLKDYERLKQIRKEKRIYRQQLNESVIKINELLKKLDKMPKVHLERKVHHKRIHHEKKKGKKVVKKKEPEFQSREIRRLESDISSLKRKISRL